MTRLNRLLLPLASVVVSSCTTRGPGAPEVPVTVERVDTQVSTSSYSLRLSPGRYRYRLDQTASIQPQGTSDTTRARLTTRALISVDVAEAIDSFYDLTVVIDSLELVSEGPASRQPMPNLISLGQVAKATFKKDTNLFENQLPDSLCSYGLLMTSVRDLLLPSVPSEIGSRLRASRDSMTATTCRGGARIQAVSNQQFTGNGSIPLTIALTGSTQLQGAGRISRDSVEVSGTIQTHGTITFADSSRLPDLVQSSSDGLVTIRLGDSTTVFRQVVSQKLQRQKPTP